MAAPVQDLIFPILLLGDIGVGKRSFRDRLVYDKFDEDSDVINIPEDKLEKMIEVDGKRVKLVFHLDLDSYQRFPMRRTPWRVIRAALVLCDVTNKSTFNNIKNWHREIDRYGREGIPAVVIANKIDMEDSREVSTAEALEFCKPSSLPFFFEVSTKEGPGIDDVFAFIKDLCRREMARLAAQTPAPPIKIAVKPKAKKKEGFFDKLFVRGRDFNTPKGNTGSN
eukprot:TRINITY_DN7250_c0_g1_i1.p1 TRINITY_DN7250_c0_g1~~TRINITY_DN7250_c0_g1_i1.p1  ORF type:complete len:224 (+),score=56.27 TRINITY_DN7250_c0_g1_i1:15-686(+)